MSDITISEIFEILEQVEVIQYIVERCEIYGWRTPHQFAQIQNPYDLKHLMPDTLDGEYDSVLYDFITAENVREVRNFLQEIVFDDEGEIIHVDDVADVLEDWEYIKFIYETA